MRRYLRHAVDHPTCLPKHQPIPRTYKMQTCPARQKFDIRPHFERRERTPEPSLSKQLGPERWVHVLEPPRWVGYETRSANCYTLFFKQPLCNIDICINCVARAATNAIRQVRKRFVHLAATCSQKRTRQQPFPRCTSNRLGCIVPRSIKQISNTASTMCVVIRNLNA